MLVTVFSHEYILRGGGVVLFFASILRNLRYKVS